MNEHSPNVRLIILIAAAGLLVYAAVTGSEAFAMASAVLFLLGGVLQVVELFHSSKKYRAGASDIWPDKRPRSRGPDR